jgi:hypothetical protein
VALMAVNFFIHGRYVMERPASRLLLLVAGVLDLLIISFFVLAWDGRATRASTARFTSSITRWCSPSHWSSAAVTLRYVLLAVGLYLSACVLGLLLPGGWPHKARPWPRPGFTRRSSCCCPAGG